MKHAFEKLWHCTALGFEVVKYQSNVLGVMEAIPSRQEECVVIGVDQVNGETIKVRAESEMVLPKM